MSEKREFFEELLPDSRHSLVAGFFLGMAVLLLAAGNSLTLVVVSLGTTLGVCIWGQALVTLVNPSAIKPRNYGLWLIGPCLGFGSLVLYFLRVFIPRDVFLVLFILLPTVLLAWRARNAIRERRSRGNWSVSPTATVSCALALIGLTGINLGLHWAWLLPVAWLSLAFAGALSLTHTRKGLFASVALTSTLIAARAVTEVRAPTWWLSPAEGIPADESTLEALSRGLIEFGPRVSTQWHGLNGVGPIGYHNLAYLLVGIIDRLSAAEPYIVLMNIAPVIISASALASMILLVRIIFPDRMRQHPSLVLPILGLLACLIAFRPTGHPSSMLGFATLLSSFVVIAGCRGDSNRWREAALAGLSIVVVAFSKGPYIIGTLTAAAAIMVTNPKARWRIGGMIFFSGLATTAFFNSVSVAAEPLRFQFWSPQTMGSQFEISFYNFKIFFGMLVIPVITGIVGSLTLLALSKTRETPWGLACLFVISFGVASQLIIVANDGIAHQGIFYVPARVASALVILLTAVAAAEFRPRGPLVAVGVAASIAVSQVARTAAARFESSSITQLSLTSGLAVLLLTTAIAVGAWRRTESRKLIQLASFSAILLISTSLVFDGIRTDVGKAEQISSIGADRRWENWYGNSSMKELVEFLKQSTESESLIAQSLCPPAEFSGDGCEPDFRLPALSGRQFLASDPLFDVNSVNSDTREDIKLSSSFGSLSPDETMNRLRDRRASYLVLEKSKVSELWITQVIQLPTAKVFENSNYVVLKLADA